MHQNATVKMFPSVLNLSHNKKVTGSVFGYKIDVPGYLTRGCETSTDREAWEHCVDCPVFETCNRLSTGTLMMEYSVRSLL